jgi:Tfp pilus assembly protein PilO|tara:strand:+ start:714 stop:1124 length:411 start_codon:yes stop_codon:yes gene_type:complete
MSRVFVISDLHLGHEKLARHRGFSDAVESLREALEILLSELAKERAKVKGQERELKNEYSLREEGDLNLRVCKEERDYVIAAKDELEVSLVQVVEELASVKRDFEELESISTLKNTTILIQVVVIAGLIGGMFLWV